MKCISNKTLSFFPPFSSLAPYTPNKFPKIWGARIQSGSFPLAFSLLLTAQHFPRWPNLHLAVITWKLLFTDLWKIRPAFTFMAELPVWATACWNQLSSSIYALLYLIFKVFFVNTLYASLHRVLHVFWQYSVCMWNAHSIRCKKSILVIGCIPLKANI